MLSQHILIHLFGGMMMSFFDFIVRKTYNTGKLGVNNTRIPGQETEFSSDLSVDTEEDNVVNRQDSGVEFYNLPDLVKLTYSGILAKNGAEDIYAVIGYGNNSNWEEVEELLMTKTAYQNFELLTRRKQQGSVNIAFRDGADHWDNNNGSNYIFGSEDNSSTIH